MTGLSEVPVLPAARVMDAAAATALVGTTVPAVPATVDSPGIWTDADTGETVLAYLPTPEPAALRNIVTRRVSWATTRRSSGMVNTSRTFGYSPRKPFQQRDSCTMSSLNRDDPDAGAYLALYAEKLAAMIGGFAPEILAADAATIEAVKPEWRLTDDALWTSGVINKSSALPYHRDAANFNAWSAMPVVRRGVPGVVLGEGARLGNRAFLAALAARATLTVVHLTADPALLDARCATRGSAQSPSWRAGAATRARNAAAVASQVGARVIELPAATPTAELVVAVRDEAYL